MTAWTVTAANRTFSDMDGAGTDYTAEDSLTINSGGQVTADLSIAGAGSLAITVNAGGVFIVNADISILFAATYGITVTEGGRMRVLGTSSAPCALTGSATSGAGHYVRCNLGGKMFIDYCTISNFLYFGTGSGGDIEVHNSTITNVGYPIYNEASGAYFRLVNCTVAQTIASRYCITGTGDITVDAIGCAFTSLTDNYLAITTTIAHLLFAGCTYQGIAIIESDFIGITCDFDVRIYEKSIATCSGNLAGCAVVPLHPSADIYGMLYDSMNYLKIPAYLSTPPTDATGISNLFLLKKNAYWPSTLAVASRTWKYWSDSSQTETGDNQKFTIGAYKSGYTCTGITAWAGAAAAITMTPSSGGEQRMKIPGVYFKGG